jgi:hypothetical protein
MAAQKRWRKIKKLGAKGLGVDDDDDDDDVDYDKTQSPEASSSSASSITYYSGFKENVDFERLKDTCVFRGIKLIPYVDEDGVSKLKYCVVVRLLDKETNTTKAPREICTLHCLLTAINIRDKIASFTSNHTLNFGEFPCFL